jgi:hypothetical protein
LIRDAHDAYITWEDFEHNVQRLRDNATALGSDREKGVPREGPALLQGLVICGVCGQRMTIRYHQKGTRRIPDYTCQRHAIENGERLCQMIHGDGLDTAIAALLVQRVTLVTLEVALAVQQEIESRSEEGDRLRRQEVERARYQTDLARRRFMQVDPDNRLVADSLEAEWNETLRALADAQERYEKQRQADRAGLNDQQRASIMAIAQDFPRLWDDPRTPARERKRMLRLLIADVTLLKGDDVRAQVRFNGGATQTLHVPLPLRSWMVTQTPAAVLAEIDRLFDHHTAGEIAAVLNRNGVISGAGHRVNRLMVTQIRKSYKLKTRIERLRARGLLTAHQIGRLLDISYDTVKIWRRAGLLVGHRYNDKGQCFLEHPGEAAPVKYRHQAKSRGRTAAFIPNDTPSYS